LVVITVCAAAGGASTTPTDNAAGNARRTELAVPRTRHDGRRGDAASETTLRIEMGSLKPAARAAGLLPEVAKNYGPALNRLLIKMPEIGQRYFICVM
jgi:hypothetical protein